jgi:hypothetical protein
MAENPPLIGVPIGYGFLTPTRVNSSKSVLAAIPRTVAGHNRAMYEHLTGQVVDDAQPPIAKKNASGVLGHDHSGGSMGRALRHTFCTCRDLGVEFTSTANETETACEARLRVFCPPCYRDGAYLDCTVNIVAYMKADGSTTGVAVFSLWADGESRSVTPQTQAIDYNGISDSFQTVSETNFQMVPGKLNAVYFKAEIKTPGVTERPSLKVHSVTFSCIGT